MARRGTQDAELVALRVGQHDPGNDTLTDVDASCAEVDESLDLELLIVRSKVEMKPVLGRRLGGTDWQEDDPREVFRFRLDLELVRIIVDDGPSERSRPPSTERNWVNGVDDHLLPSKAHLRTLREGRALRARCRATRGSANCGALGRCRSTSCYRRRRCPPPLTGTMRWGRGGTATRGALAQDVEAGVPQTIGSPRRTRRCRNENSCVRAPILRPCPPTQGPNSTTARWVGCATSTARRRQLTTGIGMAIPTLIGTTGAVRQ